MKKIIVTSLLISILFSTNSIFAEEMSVEKSRIGCFMFTQNLKLGDGIKNVDLRLVKFGADSQIAKVLELQNSLISSGYLSGNATGYFGVKTLKAVKNFQRDNNIKPTGYVGIKTQGILRSKFCNISTTGDTPIMCSYANPPSGCDYINGPDYNATTGCGMLLKCDTHSGNVNKIKDCPSEKIINMMPVMCVRAPCPAIDNSYYIYKGERKEIIEFDTNYVKNNCSVKETVAM